MPSISSLPVRSNALTFDPDVIDTVRDLLYEVEDGQGVDILDDPVDSPQKARVRGRVMAKALKADHNISVRVHVVTVEEPVTTGPKNQHTTGKFMPMVSPRKDTPLPDRDDAEDSSDDAA